ncbi:MAG: MFS transporter [Dehalococcoidales bacterium]|nr:MAG: MFS transporter [Dehalococcoidales bacterium]
MKKFFVLWSSQGASVIGSMVVEFALAWHLKEVTGSATVLATAIMVGILPMVFLAPFVGPFIDRWDRKKTMIFADLWTMLLTVILVILFYTDTIEIWHVYVALFCRTIGQIFQEPAFKASIPMVVPEKHLVRANGLTTTLIGVTIFIAPPVGAFLMKTLPMQWVLSLDIITAIIAICCLLPLRIPQPDRTTLTQKVDVIGEMVQGFRYIVSWKALFLLFGLCGIVNFFLNPLQVLLPLFVENYLSNDILKLGWLQMIFGIGVLAGGLVLGAWGGFKKRIITSFSGMIISYIAVIVFGFTTERFFFLGLSMYFIWGWSNAFVNGPISAIVQANVPRDMQGRVFSVLGSICTAAIPVGLIISGPIADAIELRWLYIFSAVILFILSLAFYFFGGLFNIENQKTAEEPVVDSVVE